MANITREQIQAAMEAQKLPEGWKIEETPTTWIIAVPVNGLSVEQVYAKVVIAGAGRVNGSGMKTGDPLPGKTDRTIWLEVGIAK